MNAYVVHVLLSGEDGIGWPTSRTVDATTAEDAIAFTYRLIRSQCQTENVPVPTMEVIYLRKVGASR